MKRFFAVIVAAAVLLATNAQAATVDDIRALGYAITYSSQCEAGTDADGNRIWKTVWTISGFGISTHLSECDPNYQAIIDSIANPAVHYERRWQYEYPDQFWAAQNLVVKCYAVNRTAPMTDEWSVAGGVVNTLAKGVDLPALAATLADRCADGPAGPSVLVPIGNAGDGTLVVPGDIKVAPAGTVYDAATGGFVVIDPVAAAASAAAMTLDQRRLVLMVA